MTVTFMDTGPWFALYVAGDPQHATMLRWLATNTATILTTDYVIDETLTLMRSRGQKTKALDFGRDVFAGTICTVHYLTEAEIAAAWGVFRRFHDKDWSFTDCTSKVVIESLAIPTAVSFDHHFRQFGTVAVVP